MDDHAASNVHTRKIKIATNLPLVCWMIIHLENKNLHQDYAALVFSRKTNKEKILYFMVDLRWTERIIQALHIIIQENSVVFNKKPAPALTSEVLNLEMTCIHSNLPRKRLQLTQNKVSKMSTRKKSPWGCVAQRKRCCFPPSSPGFES